MFKRIDHVEIVPKDFELSLRFYTEQLGFRLVDRHDVGGPPITEVAYLTLNESAIELLHAAQPQARGGRGTVGYNAMAWEVDDMQATLRELEEGIATELGPADERSLHSRRDRRSGRQLDRAAPVVQEVLTG